MPTFSKDDLMNMETEGTMETKFNPVPEGDYTGSIEKIDLRLVGENKDKAVLDLSWKLHDLSDSVKAEVGQDEPTVRQSCFLDVDDNGRLQLGKNKNIQLGRIRDAVGQNGPGRWSYSMLQGQRARVKVSHRSDPATGSIYSEIKAVAALR